MNITAIGTSTSPGTRGAIPNVLGFAGREVRDALSSRWFVLYSLVFGVLAVAVSFLSLAGVGSHGFASFGRTAAGLLNLIMLVVPLMAITVGSVSIAGERERGTLLYLLAQPVSRSEILIGKFLGLAVSLCACLCLGFGASALVLSGRSGDTGVGSFLWLVVLSCALAVTMLALGMLVSAASRKAGVALGIGLFVWLGLVFLSDLGLMAGTVLFKLRVEELFALAVAHPLQAFKMAVILDLNASLDVLGPAGTYASQEFGHALPWLLPTVIIGWGVLFSSVTLLVFGRKAPV